MSGVIRKHAFSVSDKVRHKPGCATIEGGYRYKISTLEKLDGSGTNRLCSPVHSGSLKRIDYPKQLSGPPSFF